MTSYVDPQTIHNPSTGGLPPASWGDTVRDDLEYIIRDSPTSGVYKNSDTAITTSTVTALTFNTERWDNATLHSTSSNTSRFTVPVSAKYLVCGSVAWEANATGTRQLSIRVNGTLFVGRQTNPAVASSGVSTHQELSRVVSLAANDYVELCVWHDRGSNLNILYLDAESPNFEIFFYRF